ncbi:protein bunched, class 2/F/G isoform-like isoform X2 [Periplaneta americana]|uniref:protein bunched, class 2/F/G isoform-like isoform X2 n=1 Tax=Periplaneta americana TaxID=6978 RepID=UPI0037E8B762
MADNISQKSSKPNEKTKYTNAINRTTSETMRLGEPEKVVNHPTSLISSTPNQRKKTPSFQITSVTVGSRTSNDGGDDSADDLDESHTDDMSDVIDNSRITDIENETPSYSEDTFSKEDVFFNASTTSLGTAPVIPTSSQYGLAIVASEGGGNIINAAVACANTIPGGDVHVSVTDAGSVINIVGSVKTHETEMRDAHHGGRNERFKVVKIESTEPFKRGRWLCMDYLDHTMLQQQPSQQAVINVVRSNDSSDTTVGSVQYVGPDSGVVLTDGPLTLQSMDEQIINIEQSQLKSSAVTMQEQHQAMVAAQHQVAMTGLTTGQSTAGPNNFPSVSPGQTLQQVQQSVSAGTVQPTQQHVSVTSQTHQGMQQQTLQQSNIPQSLPQSMQQVVSQQQLQQQQQNQQSNQQQNLQGQSQSMSASQQVLQQQHHAQSMSQVPIQQSMVAGGQQQQQPQQAAQHQSLPPQQIQQVMAAANLQQMQQQQQIQQQNLAQQISQQPQQSFQPQQNQQLQQPPQQQQQPTLPQQQVSSQGMVPAQQPQSQQHITAQPGQSQGQYYSIPSSTVSQQVPISQGQSGIQMVSQQPQTSISAQTQTIQTSTPSQMPSQPQQPQNVGSVPMQTMPHHQMQAGTSQNQPMQQIGQQQLPSQTSQQHNIQQMQQQQYQQMQQQASQNIQQQAMQQPQVMQQPQQTMPQVMQQPQQAIPQQTMQQPPQQAMQQQQPQQQAMTQVMQQSQAMSQVLQQQGIPQVIQQSQQPMPQQVIQQQPPPQQTLQQSQAMQQQAMQPQVLSQPPQAIQQQIHHSANLQNIQQQQIHVGGVAGIPQQQAQTSMAAMVQGQNMMSASQGQGLIAGHQMTMAGGQQVPQQAQPVVPQMVPVSSSVSNIPGTSVAQTFSHMPVSQASVQTFSTPGTTTVSSRTVPSACSVSVGLDGTVDQVTGVGVASAVCGDPSVALLESLVEVTANAEDIQPGTVTAGEDAERRMERVRWTDRVRNEALLERVGEERMMLKLIRERKKNWLGHWLRRNCLLKLKGMVNSRRVWGRRRYQMIDDIKIYLVS